MANADKGHIEIVNGSIGDLIFRIETLTSDRDTIKVCVRAANELSAMTNRIATLESENARLTAMQGEELVTLPRYMVYSMEDKLKVQAEEIRTLKQELDQLKACKHMHVKIHSRLWRASTLEEPAEFEYKAECKDCGEFFSADDVDEWAEVEE